jgi:frataxin-like iron-binding protein CyaY
VKNGSAENTFVTNLEQAKTDSRITYPCYKSFDEFIDISRLCALDDYIVERINLHIKAERDDYFLNLHRLDDAMPYQPGVREIWLTRNKPGAEYDYVNLDKTETWEQTEAAEEFSDLMNFIATLPFQETGRILIIYDNAGKEVPAHRDHLETETCNEFVWFRTNLIKPFYVLNHLTGEKKYVESYSAWFDSVNQFHGSEAVDGLSFSVRVDGKFTDEFKSRIPKPDFNPASTPAFWASFEKH